MAPLPPSDISAQGMAMVERLRAAAGISGSSEIPEMVATLLRHPSLYERHAAIGMELLGRGHLSARHRELAVLRTGWLLGAPYEWGEHVAMARRAGLNTEEIDRLTRESNEAGWDGEDHAIVRAAEELHADAMISDDTWAALAAFLDETQLIELVYVVGHYTKVAFLQNALRLRLAPGNEGLSAR